MTIYGWDASDFDHNRGMRAEHIRRAADQGIKFFTHKITEGTHVTHQHCGAKLAAARDADIPFLGAYVVVRSGPSVRAQVDHAIAQLDRQARWWRDFPGWFWQVDLEKWSYDAVPAQRGADMCRELESRGRHRAILYAPNWAYRDSIPGSDPLWASSYGQNGTGDFRKLYPGDGSSRWAAYSRRTPVILQYGSKATIGGQRTCDANGFRGSEADFARLINAPNEEDDMDQGDIVRHTDKNVAFHLRNTLRGVDQAAEQLAEVRATVRVLAGEDQAEVIREELDRHRATLVAGLGEGLTEGVLAGLREQLADVPDERLVAAAEAGARAALADVRLTVDEVSAGDGS